jgi:uncharacterized protein
MNILITGGTGLLGTALIHTLRFDKGTYNLTVLSRNYAKACRSLHASINVIDSLDECHFSDFDAIVNLAGEAIIDKRWRKQRKHVIEHSRFAITEAIVNKINAECVETAPITFISASAVGIYGPCGQAPLDETATERGIDFGSLLCQQWETIAGRAKNARIATVRTGIVLSNQGGALEKMLPPFWCGLGGKIANGEHFMPWIHIKDWSAAILFLLNHPISGPINVTSPNPVTNKVFTDTLSTILHRPAFFTIPKFVLRLAMGESADLLLFGQNAIPAKLLSNHFEFQYSELTAALDDLLLV